MRPRRRTSRSRAQGRVQLLAAGAIVVAVGTAMVRDDDAPPPRAEVPGTALVGATAIPPPIGTSTTAGPLTDIVVTEETEPAAAEPALPPLDLPAAMTGDAALAGLLDPTAIARVEDHYEIPLGTGRSARLTLDPTFQEAATSILRESRAPRGAIVVLAPDGSVLALAGRRATDPMGSVDGTPDNQLALDVWAPAASIFKIVTAAALVEAGVRPDSKVCYHGGVRSVMESNLTDSKKDSRCESLTYGVAHSQNAIIAKLVHQHLAPADLATTAATLGVSGATPAWAFARSAGTVTVPADKGVDLGKTAAGFINSELSPIGGALLASAIGNHGKVGAPRIVASIVDGDRAIEVGPSKPHQAIAAATADAVAGMMLSTCTNGSAAKSFRQWKGDRIAGKTGTLAIDEPTYVEYSWFVGFVETKRGAVAIAVVLGNAESWWMKAHTAARRVLDRAFKPKA
jgi:penicillin-binding protein A